jgi:hypothetical protein
MRMEMLATLNKAKPNTEINKMFKLGSSQACDCLANQTAVVEA